MKAFIGEIFDPIKDFYNIRIKSEKIIIIVFPILVGCISYLISFYISPDSKISRFEFVNDIIGQFITILALFISFNMGYLSLILTSSSKNVEDMKTAYSDKRFKDKKSKAPYSVYEILTSEITYTLIMEIFFLMLCIFEKILLGIFSNAILRIIICLNVAAMIHIVIMLLVIVKNIYFGFWRPI